MSLFVPMSVRSEVLEQLLACPTALDILLSDRACYDAAKQILWRKDNQPAIGSLVYLDGSYGDVFELVVLEQHMDFTITVTDKSPASAAHGRKERLLTWRFKP